ncbi:saccharopine dehydrogenase NADP-binding domain-containing protein [Candidatus Pacearchaeota archaeon]|nr:saccharopine dehydrogenase NADP-binding domain-containing protein [Candidatus Pacearchaeota archaeon]
MAKEYYLKPKKIVFFGLGAVASVMATSLYELFQREGVEQIRFVFIIRDPRKAKQYLYKAPQILKVSQFKKVKDFELIFRNNGEDNIQLKDADILINASSPEFNEPILKLAVKLKSCYCDLASDISNIHSLKAAKFPQQNFHEKLDKVGVFGLINIGASPGMTNFLVGEKIMDIRQSKSLIKIKAINLYLLEQIDTDQIVFSWAPTIALDELEEKPQYLKDGKLITAEPFSNSQTYKFPHFQREVAEYPIFQEELLSFHDSFPEIKSLKILSGGSEDELIKNLFQLNLLSKKNIECTKKNMSVEQIVRAVFPGMKTPKKIEELQKKGVIKYAQFTAMIEVVLEMKNNKGKTTWITETSGLSFNRYLELLRTPYSGSTYISYPTGISAAILLFYTYHMWKKNKQKFSGILKAEELPAKIGSEIVNKIKLEMSSHMIDFVSHTHSLLQKRKDYEKI